MCNLHNPHREDNLSSSNPQADRPAKHHAKARPFAPDQPCPACGKHDSCRQLASGVIHCRHQSGDIPGLDYLGVSKYDAELNLYRLVIPPAPKRPRIVVNPDGIPEYLRTRPRFINWSHDLRRDKNPSLCWTKVPIEVQLDDTRILASGTVTRPGLNIELGIDHLDPANHKSFDEVVEAIAEVQARWALTECVGIGFVMTPEDGLVMIDLDKCRDAETGESDAWALAIVYALNCYTEVSTSGTGYRVFAKGKKRGPLCNYRFPPDAGYRPGAGIEIYSEKKFSCLTGNRFMPDVLPAEPMERQAELDVVYAEVFRDQLEREKRTRQSRAELGSRVPPAPPARMDDATVIARIRASKSADKFSRLFDRGDLSTYGGDASAADYALAGMLLFWCQLDTGQVERIMRLSALVRPKWSEARGEESWLGRTIRRALERHDGGYYGDGSWKPETHSRWKADRDAELEAIGPADPADVEQQLLAGGRRSGAVPTPVCSTVPRSSPPPTTLYPADLLGGLDRPPSEADAREAERVRRAEREAARAARAERPPGTRSPGGKHSEPPTEEEARQYKAERLAAREAARAVNRDRPPPCPCGFMRSMFHAAKGIWRACRVGCGRWSCATCGPQLKAKWAQHVHEMVTMVPGLGGPHAGRGLRPDPVYLAYVRDDTRTIKRIERHVNRAGGAYARVKYSPGRQLFVCTVPFPPQDGGECASPFDAAAEVGRVIWDMRLYGDSKKPIHTSRNWKLPPKKPRGWKVVADFPKGASQTSIVESMETVLAGRGEIKEKWPTDSFLLWTADCPLPMADKGQEDLTLIELARAFHGQVVNQILGVPFDDDDVDTNIDQLFGVPAGP